MMRGKRVLVTGGAGFIGSHLVDELVLQGASVTILDDFSNGRENNLAGPASAARVVRGSICDSDAVAEAIAASEIVFHLAALGSVPRSLKNPEHYVDVNVRGTLKVLEAARTAGVRRVIYSASSSAYGNTPSLPKRESMRPDPLSPYAFTKLAGEHLMRVWSACFALETVSLRYFNIFGPRQRHDSPYAAVIPKFAAQLRSGERPEIFGDGNQSRDFTFIDNAVQANVRAAEAPQAKSGQVVNIACGARFSLLELLDQMSKIIGVSCDPKFLPPRAGDVRDSEADITAASELIGYQVRVPFHEGLRRTLQWTGKTLEV